jgi:hypothetical protein
MAQVGKIAELRSLELDWHDSGVDPVPINAHVLVLRPSDENKQELFYDVGGALKGGSFLSLVRPWHGPTKEIIYWIPIPDIPTCDDCGQPAELGIVIGTSMNERSVCAECAKQYLPCNQCQDLVHKSGLIPIDDHDKGIDVCYDCYVWLEP